MVVNLSMVDDNSLFKLSGADDVSRRGHLDDDWRRLSIGGSSEHEKQTKQAVRGLFQDGLLRR